MALTGRTARDIDELRQFRLAPGIVDRNVGEVERIASAVAGAALAAYGLRRGSLGGLVLAATGGGLLYRGLTGHCYLYQALGVNTTAEPRGPATSVPAGQGAKVEASLVVDRSPAELFRFWRNLENLPRIMTHLESVSQTSQTGSHWVAQAPLGTVVEWDAEIINERENELIAWRSLVGSTVDNAGSVHFEPAGPGATRVKVSLKYDPPGGKLGVAAAKLLGEEPQRQIDEDLQRFKQMMEAASLPPGAAAIG
ncbi:MAG: YgaP-like transmembrane domain [Pirellulales bacterium]